MSTDDTDPRETDPRETNVGADAEARDEPSLDEPSPIEDEAAVAGPDEIDRWTLMRDLFVFQGKLLLDGLRDLILSPLSIGAAIIALVVGGERPSRHFYDLLYMGKRTEKWINLFGRNGPHCPPLPFIARIARV